MTSRSEFYQDEFDDVSLGLKQGPNWCYVVMYRASVNELIPDSWSQWVTDFVRPNHFRSIEDAYGRMSYRINEEDRKVKLGLLEFKVEPKYLGFVPAKDEAWIQ